MKLRKSGESSFSPSVESKPILEFLRTLGWLLSFKDPSAETTGSDDDREVLVDEGVSGYPLAIAGRGVLGRASGIYGASRWTSASHVIGRRSIHRPPTKLRSFLLRPSSLRCPFEEADLFVGLAPRREGGKHPDGTFVERNLNPDRARGFRIDLDGLRYGGLSALALLETLRKGFGLHPTFVVKTSPLGFHVVFLCRSVIGRRRLKRLIRAAFALLRGDREFEPVADPAATVLTSALECRVPGSVNSGHEGFRCEVAWGVDVSAVSEGTCGRFLLPSVRSLELDFGLDLRSSRQSRVSKPAPGRDGRSKARSPAEPSKTVSGEKTVVSGLRAVRVDGADRGRPTKRTSPVVMFEGPIPAELLSLSPHSDFESVLRLLLTAPDLDSEEGGGLSRTWIAKSVRKGAPRSRLCHQQVGRFYQVLADRGLLERVNESFVRGRTAQKWRVRGPLLDLWKDARSTSGRSRLEAALTFLRREHPMVQGRSYENTPSWWRLLVREIRLSEEDVADLMDEGSTCAAKRRDHLDRLLHLTKVQGEDDDADFRAGRNGQVRANNCSALGRSLRRDHPSRGRGPRRRRPRERAS
jgi:hypothetical protein